MRFFAMSVLLLACAGNGQHAGPAPCSPRPTLTVPVPVDRYIDFLFVADVPLPRASLEQTVAELDPHGSYRFGLVTARDLHMHAIGDAAPATCLAPRDGADFIAYDPALHLDNLPPGEELLTALTCLTAIAPVSDAGADVQGVADAALQQNPTFARFQVDTIEIFATQPRTTDIAQLLQSLFGLETTGIIQCLDPQASQCVVDDFLGDNPTREVPRCPGAAGGTCWQLVPDPRCGAKQRVEVVRAADPTPGTYTNFYCNGCFEIPQ
jgi:hypothetical protein